MFAQRLYQEWLNFKAKQLECKIALFRSSTLHCTGQGKTLLVERLTLHSTGDTKTAPLGATNSN